MTGGVMRNIKREDVNTGLHDLLPTLYDLVASIGKETSVKPLLTSFLQRLLFHTSYSAGFVCLNVAPRGHDESEIEVYIDAAVGDLELVGLIGKQTRLPYDLICTSSEQVFEQMFLLQDSLQTRYNSSFRLPLGSSGVVVLLAVDAPVTKLPLKQMFKPVMAHLEKAIEQCRINDERIAAAAARQAMTEMSLRQSEASFDALVELSPIGVAFSDADVAVNVNHVLLEMFGYSELSEIPARSLLLLLAPQRQDVLLDHIALLSSGAIPEKTCETMGLRKDGSEFPVLVSAKHVVTPEGPRIFSFFIDLSVQKQHEQALQASNEMLQAVIENAPFRIFWKDREFRFLGCNAAFARDAGFSKPLEVIGKDDFQMCWQQHGEMYRADDIAVMESNTAKLDFEEPQITPDGAEISLRTSKVPLHDAAGEVIGVLGIYEDITERKKIEAQVHQLAFYDPLTHLPNRRLLQDRLMQISGLGERLNQHAAVLFLDLDNFKTLNDSRGHGAGDSMLVEAAYRLNSCVREGDTVARLGGDEFVVVLGPLSEHADEAAERADMIAEKIRESLAQPYQLDEYVFYSTASIGVVVFKGHQQSPEVILKHADTAMYQAKDAGRNNVRFYDPDMQAAIEAHARLENDLRHALGKRQFELHYQIQVDSLRCPRGAEALLRWQHPKRGLVLPDDFIPLAEEMGSIVEIGNWVLRDACAQLKKWEQDELTRELTLAVNVSAKQLLREDFVDSIRSVLADSGINPALLKLELTESAVLVSVEETIAKMLTIKAMGVSFSLDDFGTGYSSLQYLKRLPLDRIKIDQSFVRDIAHDANDAAIVQTIIAMCGVLGLSVIAEGVMTEAQLESLELHGCHDFQGYLFGKPVPAAAFDKLLRDSVHGR